MTQFNHRMCIKYGKRTHKYFYKIKGQTAAIQQQQKNQSQQLDNTTPPENYAEFTGIVILLLQMRSRMS